jgi:hypothetical protein
MRADYTRGPAGARWRFFFPIDRTSDRVWVRASGINDLVAISPCPALALGADAQLA